MLKFFTKKRKVEEIPDQTSSSHELHEFKGSTSTKKVKKTQQTPPKGTQSVRTISSSKISVSLSKAESYHEEDRVNSSEENSKPEPRLDEERYLERSDKNLYERDDKRYSETSSDVDNSHKDRDSEANLDDVEDVDANVNERWKTLKISQSLKRSEDLIKNELKLQVKKAF